MRLGTLLTAIVVLAATTLPGAAECIKNPETLLASHSRAIKMSSGCWVGVDVKPATRGNRGHHHKHRKGVMRTVRSQGSIQHSDIRPHPPLLVGAGGAVVPIFNDGDNLSATLKRCLDDWDKNHVAR